MSELVPSHPRPPAARPAPGTLAPGAVGKTLQQIRETYLVAFEAWDSFKTSHRDLERVLSDALGRQLRFEGIANERWRLDELREARRRLGAIPTSDVLAPLLSQTADLLDQSFDRERARFMIAMLVDAFPNARPHAPQVYFEALCHELEVRGYPPAAIAHASAQLRRNSTFPPAIAEVLQACDQALAVLTRAKRVSESAIAIRAEAERAVAALEAQGEITPELEAAAFAQIRKIRTEEKT